MSISLLRSRKGAHPIMALVVGAIVMFIGIYATMQVIASISLPTNTYSEQLTLTNTTYTSVSKPYISAIDSIANATHTYPTRTGTTNSVEANYTWTITGIKLYSNETYLAGAYNVSYTYNLQQANNTLSTTETTFWNSMQLGAISLITVAASLVLGSFFFK